MCGNGQTMAIVTISVGPQVHCLVRDSSWQVLTQTYIMAWGASSTTFRMHPSHHPYAYRVG